MFEDEPNGSQEDGSSQRFESDGPLLKMIKTEFSPITLETLKLKWPRLSPLVWIFAGVILVGSWFLFPDGGFDWRNDIGPGARHWWPAPWDHGLILAPWGATLLSPLGGLPDRIATALTNGMSVLVFALVARKLGGPDWIAIPVLISPPGYWLFYNGQTEWLILIGLLFFNGLDIAFLMLKPQIALGAVVARLRRASDQWKHYLLPSFLLFLCSLIVWPMWPLKILEAAPTLTAGSWNSALWPWGIPVGIFLLWYSWKYADERWGIAATPFLFPYINLPNYLGLMIALAARWPKWALIAWALMWAVGIGIALIG